MMRPKWNRQTKKSPIELKNYKYEIIRVRPKKRKKRHPGYTIMPEHKLWIFEKNK